MPKFPAKFMEPQSRGVAPYRGPMRVGGPMRPGGPKLARKPPAPARLAPIDWTNLPLKEFKKNFLNESETCKYSDDAIANFYGKAEARHHARARVILAKSNQANAAQVSTKVRCPFFEVSETPFPQSMQDQYRSEGFKEPLPLHAISWPYILSGQNFAGVAQCGRDSLIYTYALPALLHVQDRIATAGVAAAGGDSGPFALILTDVKKQGERIVEKLKVYGEPLGIKCHLVSGGHEKKTENDPVEMGLKDNPHIVVACLGQTMSDLLLSKKLNLKRCSFLVLDDGCRLIKNALLLKDILGQIRNDRQIVLWTSAFSTVGTETTVIKALAPFGFNDYLRLFFGSIGHFTNPDTVKHVVLPVTEATRLTRFSYLIQNILVSAADPSSPKKAKFLICCNTPDKVSRILNLLLSIGLQARHFVKPRKIVTDAAATSTTDAGKTATGDKKEGDKDVEAEDETAEPAVDNNSQLTPRERNDLNMSENPTTHFWITYTSTPLEDTDYAVFDYLLNFDFPIDNLGQFGLRAAKFNTETGGKGTIYSFVLDTDGPRVNKYLANFLQDANQYTLPKLYESQPKSVKANGATAGNPNQTKVNPNQLNARHPNAGGGPMQRNRFVGPGGRPQPYGPAMGRPNFNANGNRFGPGGGPRGGAFAGGPPMRGGPGPRNFGPNGPGNFGPKGPGGNFGNGPSANFGGRPSGNNFGGGPGGNFGGNGPAGNFGGGPGANFGDEPRNNRFSGGGTDDMMDVSNPNAGVLDALKLLTQLKQNLSSTPATPQKIDIPFYRRGESPPPANNFGPNDMADNDFSSDNVRPGNKAGGNFGFSSSFLSENSSRNQFGDSFNSMGGGRGGNSGGRGGNWGNNNSGGGGGGGNRSFNNSMDNGGGNQRRFGMFSKSNWSNNF